MSACTHTHTCSFTRAHAHVPTQGSPTPLPQRPTRPPRGCRYVAIGHPVQRTPCAPWPGPSGSSRRSGGSRLSTARSGSSWRTRTSARDRARSAATECPQPYLPIYPLDFALFFATPLLVATALYRLIGRVLFQSALPHPPHPGAGHGEAWQEPGTQEKQPRGPGGSPRSSRKQVGEVSGRVGWGWPEGGWWAERQGEVRGRAGQRGDAGGTRIRSLSTLGSGLWDLGPQGRPPRSLWGTRGRGDAGRGSGRGREASQS